MGRNSKPVGKGATNDPKFDSKEQELLQKKIQLGVNEMQARLTNSQQVLITLEQEEKRLVEEKNALAERMRQCASDFKEALSRVEEYPRRKFEMQEKCRNELQKIKDAIHNYDESANLENQRREVEMCTGKFGGEVDVVEKDARMIFMELNKRKRVAAVTVKEGEPGFHVIRDYGNMPSSTVFHCTSKNFK